MKDNIAESDSVHRAYDWEEVVPVVAIMEMIAESRYGEVTEIASDLDPPLQKYIDIDDLNALVQNGNLTFITLRIPQYHIQIHENMVGVSPIAED